MNDDQVVPEIWTEGLQNHMLAERMILTARLWLMGLLLSSQ